MTSVMNSMGQEGDFKKTNLPIKNRVNALDVSLQNNYCVSVELKIAVKC